MQPKSKLIPAVFFLCSVWAIANIPANAQFPNWANNQTNQIQQDAASGYINSSQAAQLENRDAQIQAQEQQLMNQQGGALTPQQQQQFASQFGHVNHALTRDMQGSNPAAYPAATYPPANAAQWQNYQNWRATQYQQAQAARPNYYPPQTQSNANGQYYWRQRHYRQWQQNNPYIR